MSCQTPLRCLPQRSVGEIFGMLVVGNTTGFGLSCERFLILCRRFLNKLWSFDLSFELSKSTFTAFGLAALDFVDDEDEEVTLKILSDLMKT